jgi:hypothetical protein
MHWHAAIALCGYLLVPIAHNVSGPTPTFLFWILCRAGTACNVAKIDTALNVNPRVLILHLNE